jgi:nucleotide-binding universal stress UspA family protein
MYKTILLTLDGTPTDRAIIEHIKQLAKLTQGRVVLLHVADGWAARTFGPDAISPEITEDTAYLKKVRNGISIRRHSRRGGTGLWRSAEGNRQVGRAKGLRPHRHGRTRPPAVW